MDPTALIRRARAIKAHTVFAPDVLFDSKGTIKAFKEFVGLKYEEGLVCDIAGVPQAANPADWWDCFQFMDLHSDCALIGLSILSIPKAFRRSVQVDRGQPITDSRVHLIQQLYSYADLSGRRITPCHLLGLGESYDDIKEARKLLSRDIVSNDSSSTFVHGQSGVVYDDDGQIPGGKIKERLDFSLPLDHRFYKDSCVYRNIDIAKRIAQKDNHYGT